MTAAQFELDPIEANVPLLGLEMGWSVSKCTLNLHEARRAADSERIKDLHAKRFWVAGQLNDAGDNGRRWVRGRPTVQRVDETGQVYEVDQMRRYGKHAVERWVYESGPAMGYDAIDPCKVAEKVAGCCREWTQTLNITEAGLAAIPVPRACGVRHVCPVCAAERCKSRARAARSVLKDRREAGEVGAVALVTLTQRAIGGEDLGPALERWKLAWHKLRSGRAGQRLFGPDGPIAAAYYGVELGGDAAERGLWHVHGHVVVALRPGWLEANVREQLGIRWADVTDVVSYGNGWNPWAGGCDMDGWRVTDWGGRYNTFAQYVPAGWWRSIDLESDKELYQACKYPTPITKLSTRQLAEFVSVAHGRRWQDGTGWMRGIEEQAAALEETEPLVFSSDDDTAAIEDRGINIAVLRPDCSPDLAAIAPDWGLAPTGEVAEMSWAVWELAEWMDAPDNRPVLDAVRLKARDLGGKCCRGPAGAWLVALPGDWANAEARRWARVAGPPQLE